MSMQGQHGEPSATAAAAAATNKPSEALFASKGGDPRHCS